MADVDIDPFGYHDKPDDCPDTGESIPLTTRGAIGGSQLEDHPGNQNENKKHHSEEGNLKKAGSPNFTLTVCTRSYLSIMAKSVVKPLYNNIGCEGKLLYFKGMDKLLINEDGKLRTFGKLKSIQGV